MSTELLSDEDQMAAALAELRTEKSEPQDAALATTQVDQPAAAPVATDPPTDASTTPAADSPAAESQPAAKEDPAETLRKTQEELHRAQSEIGRVKHLNRHLNETRAQLEQIRQENARLKQAPATGTPVVEGAAAKLAELSEKLKDFPELSGIVGALQESMREIETKAAHVAKQAAAQVVEPLEELRAEQQQKAQEQRTAAYEAAMGTFQSTYPTATAVVQSPEFGAWIKAQPQTTQVAFYRGQTPDEAIAVMDSYDAHLRRSGRPSIAQTPNQPAAPAAQKASTNAARLQAAVGLPSRNSGAKGGMPPEDDFEASLDFFRRKRLAAA
jgi:hypothetical protein